MSFQELKTGARVAAPKVARDLRVLVLSATTAAMLAACGGGTGSGSTQTAGEDAVGHDAQIQGTKAGAGDTTHADAFRLLTQATFGPTDADVSNVMNLGASAWLDSQLAMAPQANYLARWNADNAVTGNAGNATVDSAIYQAAFANPDQLRQRVAYALSQIFVTSLQQKSIANAKSNASAAYYDMLTRDAFGNFRTLIEDVTLSPAMGQYLSSLGNAKEDPKTGRIPD